MGEYRNKPHCDWCGKELYSFPLDEMEEVYQMDLHLFFPWYHKDFRKSMYLCEKCHKELMSVSNQLTDYTAEIGIKRIA